MSEIKRPKKKLIIYKKKQERKENEKIKLKPSYSPNK